nr:BV-like protein [Cotesia vestalis bracovirus]
MWFEYMVYVPKEWSGHSKEFLVTVIKNKAGNQWQVYGRLDGTTIRLRDVTGVLVYYRYCPWLKKCDDLKTHPDQNEYFGVKMDCLCCSLACCSWPTKSSVYH